MSSRRDHSQRREVGSRICIVKISFVTSLFRLSKLSITKQINEATVSVPEILKLALLFFSGIKNKVLQKLRFATKFISFKVAGVAMGQTNINAADVAIGCSFSNHTSFSSSLFMEPVVRPGPKLRRNRLFNVAASMAFLWVLSINPNLSKKSI